MSPPARSSRGAGSGLTLPALLEEIAAGRVRPAYLLAGSEALLRDDAVAALRGAALDEGASDFNFDRLDGESAGPADLVDAANSLPVMAARRLVWLREPEGRKGRASGLLDALADLVPTLAERSDIVLVVSAASVDKRSRWVKTFQEPAGVVDCAPPSAGRALASWVMAEATRQGVAMNADAAQALAEATGPELLLLRHEIEKASLYAGPGQTVTRAHVLGTVSDVAEDPIWDLTDAIGEGRKAEALRVLGRLQAGGAPGPVLLASLAGHFRKLLRARYGEDPKGHPFAVRKIQSQSQRYRPARLAACLRAIHEVDEVLKGAGQIDPELAMQRLVIGLAD